jgi:multidrug efflux pump
MTSLSTILGILPIALALGAGAESRRSMGIAVVGGMIIGTALTLLVIPAIYTFLASRSHVRDSADEDEGKGEAAAEEPAPTLTSRH